MAVTIVVEADFRIKKRNLSKLVAEILKLLGVKSKSLSIVFVSKETIRKINKEFRKIDAYTDVISFYGYDDGYLGDIIVCPDIVMENAAIYNESFEKELVRVIIHGILHLIGYRDYEEKERLEMFEKQEQVLAQLKTLKILM